MSAAAAGGGEPEGGPERTGFDPDAVISRVISSQLMPEVRRRELSCYVALGDSFTAGSGCPEGLGWADRLASGLRARHASLSYRNFAVDGATSAEVMEQLGEAVELEPDLVTIVCGANDILRSTRPDVDAYSRHLAGIFRRLRGAVPRVRIVTATSPERWDFVRLGPRTRERIETQTRCLNGVTRGLAEAHRVPCLDVAGHPELADRDNFAADGLHPSPKGHARAARGFAGLLRQHYEIDTGRLEGDVA